MRVVPQQAGKGYSFVGLVLTFWQVGCQKRDGVRRQVWFLQMSGHLRRHGRSPSIASETTWIATDDMSAVLSSTAISLSSYPSFVVDPFCPVLHRGASDVEQPCEKPASSQSASTASIIRT